MRVIPPRTTGVGGETEEPDDDAEAGGSKGGADDKVGVEVRSCTLWLPAGSVAPGCRTVAVVSEPLVDGREGAPQATAIGMIDAHAILATYT